MLRVYLDRAYKRDPNDDVMCVALVVYKPAQYKQFVKIWNPMLKEWNADNFHATDFYGGWGEFKRNTEERQNHFLNDSKRIPRMIGKYVERVLVVSFKPTEFERVVPPLWKKTIGTSTHSQAVQLALISNGWWREDHYPKESFAYFMESGDEDEGEVVKTVELMRNDKRYGTGKVISVSSFTTVCKKEKVRGLEAADFVAWHWNKFYMDKVRIGDEETPRKDFAAFISVQKQDAVEFIFPTEERLKFYFSRIPEQILRGE
jgi:hypothetical protein